MLGFTILHSNNNGDVNFESVMHLNDLVTSYISTKVCLLVIIKSRDFCFFNFFSSKS